MLFHYALVDDLITKEEFEQRVEKKIDECGDLVDEPTAAMMVVGELGREHVKIKGLCAKSSLFSFFGKVVDKTEPKEFDRADGEKGWVATLLLGDETGTTRVVLWDEKAGAALDVTAGEALEVIGRHPGKNTREIYALALRKVSIEIAGPVLKNGNASLSNEPVELDVLLVFRGEPRTYTRRDGSTGEMVEALVADATGTARLVAWAPDLLRSVSPGSCLHITGAKPNQRDEGRSYSLDEKSTVVPTDLAVSVPFTPPGSVGDQGIYSVTGEVKQVQQPRSFTARNGTPSWVKNIVITDGSDDLNVVLWGDHALVPLAAGDKIEVFHATAKPGRFGNIELAAGRGSVVRIPDERAWPIVFSGTIIPGPGCTFIDNGSERYLIDADFPTGTELQVTGTVRGSRILPEEIVPVAITPETVTAHIASLKKALDE
ncbi:single-stranded DNA-binding protein [Methanoregula formicica]|uniref:Single-stranded DNA-binding protein n=1 Tax=Methanoregula formicica (strain DSM 22288 / NBRC 105244 / SMSP) TaxID=593750 RepID=L0HES4_METFS|nr:single-stranded DNA-binding protein [Methanoregula formicica]AGB01813.1 single-stranded DNA-binding protein [Methanoregula formicica SMSP]